MMANGADNPQGIVMVPVENLLLDHANPRLSSGAGGSSQEALLEELYRRYNLRDVLLSLAQHGYFSEEPLIAVPRGNGDIDKAKEFTVVEGNRRLAALKLLLFEEARKSVDSKGLPEPTIEALPKLNPVPVKLYEHRAEIIPYLGVRHITGVKPWDSQSKAKYVRELVEEGYSISEVTKMVASRSDVVSRGLLTLYVLEQANNNAAEPWGEQAESFSFSFLYTALGYSSTQKLLGLSGDAIREPQKDPVSEDRLGELNRVMVDLYGTPDGSKPAVLDDSREIAHLAAIYDSPEAFEALRIGMSLEQAYRKSGGERTELVELIREASGKLDEANAIAPHHKDTPEALRWTVRCKEAVEQLVKTLGG